MDLRNIYSLGTNLGYIGVSGSLKPYVKGENYLIEAFERAVRELEKTKLCDSTQLAIKKMIDKLNKSYKEKEELRKEDGEEISDLCKLWHDRIMNELRERAVIEVFTEGTLNPKKLLAGGKEFFGEETWNELSIISKNDLDDACNCLLTQSWTPAVMISLRAAEDNIRIFYKEKTKKNPPEGWNDILRELETTKIMDKTLIGYLDYIREMRNKAEHPDKIFNQTEAEGAFHQVIDIIRIINEEIKAQKTQNITVAQSSPTKI